MRGFRLLGVVVAVCGILGCVPAGALALGGGRTYEMVSPTYKGGYGALHIEAVTHNGESVLFYSPGAFAGAPSSAVLGFDYVSRRGSSSWSTDPLVVPATQMPYTVDRDVSPTLESVLVLGKPGANQEGADQTGTEGEFLLHSVASPDTAANWALAGPILKTFPEEVIGLRYAGASPDFCHILVEPAPLKGDNWLLPEEAGNTARQIYEIDRGCSGEPTVRRVGVNNENKVISRMCRVDVGIEGYAALLQSSVSAVADGGREIFFTTSLESGCTLHQLFVRLNGRRTLEVSKPPGEACPEVPCSSAAETRPSADFVGASEDGSTVFFTTTAPLAPATDKDTGNDLYMAKIGCPEGEPRCEAANRIVTSLVQVSADSHAGEAAEVQGIVRVAPDGERTYLVARGDLLSAATRSRLEGEGRAVPHAGAENLYAYDSISGQMGFIGDLCSGKELSGAAEDVRCPNKAESDIQLWSGSGEAQSAGPDGRFLVFATYAQLVVDDTDGARDIYRYDAVTGALERISGGENGYHANGNDSRFDASIAAGEWGDRGHLQSLYALRNRAVSEDGSRIVFVSSESLSAAATNNLSNVYEWHQGVAGGGASVSLVSSGSAEEPVEDVVISPEGNDVFFLTSQGLVPQDVDGAPDVYDARVHGGFAVAPAEREPCAGDACQGPLTNPAPLLVPGSVSQAPGENFAQAGKPVSSKVKKTTTSVKRKARRKARRAVHMRHRVSKRGRGRR